MARARALLLVGTLSWAAVGLGCTAPSPPAEQQPEPEPKPEPKPEVPPEAPPEPEVPPEPEPEPEPPTPEELDATKPVPLVPKLVEPRAVDADWEIVGEAPPGLAFTYVAAGIIGEAHDGNYELDRKTQTLVDAAVDLREPDEHEWIDETAFAGLHMVGYWPDDVWGYGTRTVDTEMPNDADPRGWEPAQEFRLVHLWQGKKWAVAKIDGQLWSVLDDQVLRKSWAGGFLIFEGRFASVPFTRVGGGDRPAPSVGLIRSDRFHLFFEAEGGELYTAAASQKWNVMWMQGHCEDADCVARKAAALPVELGPVFLLDVSRGGDSMSMLVANGARADAPRFLLHVDDNRWSLETLPEASGVARHIWPVADGGLWVETDEELLHRAPDGTWREVALPAGMAQPSFAMDRPRKQLWLAGEVDGSWQLARTDAKLQRHAQPRIAPIPPPDGEPPKPDAPDASDAPDAPDDAPDAPLDEVRTDRPDPTPAEPTPAP